LKLSDFKNRVKNAGKYKAQAGWFESAKYDNGIPVASVAVVQEYGNTRVPVRSFMRSTMYEKGHEWNVDIGKVIKQVLNDNMTSEQGMHVIAQKVAGDIRQKITEIFEPPLSDATLKARKRKRGSSATDKPLIDTGHMLATLTGVAIEK